MRHIIPISGKDSLATAILQKELNPGLNYEYVFNPTGAEYPEVFEWISRVEEYLKKPITQVGRNLERIIKGYGYFLPGPNTRYCTRESKIEPFEEWINGDYCNVYFGIRSDEKGRGGYDNSRLSNINPVYPLIENNIDLEGVLILINSQNLHPPKFYWDRMYKRVQSGFSEDIKNNIPGYVFDLLFSGRSRANCYFCWAQRQYELVYMLEEYPDLFEKMASWEGRGAVYKEKEVPFFGEKYKYGYEKKFHWKSGVTMDEIRGSSHKIFEKRAQAVSKQVRKLIDYGKINLSSISMDDMDSAVLNITSCGLMCAK